MKKIILSFIVSICIYFAFSEVADAQYLKRSLASAPEVKIDLSTATAHYSPLFGEGDDNSSVIRGASRYGRLIVDPGGNTKPVRYDNEEHVIFILGGTGIISYSKEEIPVSKNDFMYIPQGMEFSLSNPREQQLTILLMGFRLKPESCTVKTEGLMIANTDEVKFQTLPSHGPTTQFQLLMGTTESTRDRLAAACQVTSLFIMDFASGGTNNPHNHGNEEEIYLVLRGGGDIVAGRKEDGSDMLYPSVEGDVYFYSPKTQIGFYSGNKPEEEHARILAVRFNYF